MIRDELALAAVQAERLRLARRARLVRAARDARSAAGPAAAPGPDVWDVVLAGFARAAAAR